MCDSRAEAAATQLRTANAKKGYFKHNAPTKPNQHAHEVVCLKRNLQVLLNGTLNYMAPNGYSPPKCSATAELAVMQLL